MVKTVIRKFITLYKQKLINQLSFQMNMLKNKSQKLREKDSWIKAGMNEFRKHGKYNKKLILDT